jgi:feruloyl esterase
MYPFDFDGIVAGAPGVDFNNLYSWRARFYTITGPSTGPNFIPAKAWQTWIHDEVLGQCDALDGVRDGIIEDPAHCHFDPTRLLCNTTSNTTSYSNATNCLNENQVHQLTQIYAPYYYPDSTHLIFPAMQPGNEIVTSTGLYAGTPWPLSTEWFKYAVYNNASWDPSSYSSTDALFSDTLNPANIRTYPSSLPLFEHRGGKLLMYHGLQDNQITSFNSIRFYEWLRGRRSYNDMDTWARFFRISGMGHCSGGPGAWVVGQGGNTAQAGVPYDRRFNVLRALVDWVERGVAPEFVEGTKFVGDRVAGGVDFRRRHCK